MRKLALIVIAGSILIATGAAAALFSQPKVIFRKGPDTWVKIAKGNPKLAPFDHPHEVTPEELARVLRTVSYFQPSSYALGGKKGEVQPLFQESDLAILAEPLRKAFAQAGTDEWVDFSLTVFRGPQFFGSFRLTDGVMFWKEGRLQVAFRNLNVKTEPGQTQNSYDPTRGYRALNHLTAAEGQTLKAENWTAIDLAAMPAPVPVAAPGAPAPAPPAAAPQKSAADRLRELDQLKKDGLITEEEYQRKRQQILDEL